MFVAKKTLVCWMFVFFLNFIVCSICIQAEEGQIVKKGPLRILLIVGGHSYDKENLHKMLAAMPDSTFREIELPKDQDLLKPGLEKDFDILVFHDQSQFELSEGQIENLKALWTQGMPTVMLHHALISHNKVPLFREVYGTAYLIKEMEIDGKKYPASTYMKPVEVHFQIVDKEHPITKGLSDFTLLDEVFGDLYIKSDIHLLIKTDHPKSSSPIVWTRQYAKSRVFVMIQGHDGVAFNNPSYRELFYRGVRWAAGQLGDK